MKIKYALFLITLVSMTSVFCQVPTNGLVSYYPFNGNAIDETCNSNDGVLHGNINPTTDRFGNENAAYNFDGIDDYIKINNAVGFDNEEFTYSVWVNPDTMPNFGEAFNIFELGSQNPAYGQLFSINNNYFSTVGWRVTSGNEDGTSVGFQNNVLPNSNAWYHVVVSRSDSVKIYVNGIQLLSYSTNGLLPFYNSVVDTYIGTRSQLFQFFNGKIDDVRIYNRAITPAEVTAICNESLCYQYITVTDTLIINGAITGFNPITYQNTIKIYPNPTNDHITIDNGDFTSLEGYTLKITDSYGQTVFINEINQEQFYVDLSSWTGNGIYFVYIIDPLSNIIDIRKIVLQ